MISVYDQGASVNIAGTFYCGAVNATYDELVECFGQPSKSDLDDSYKVNVEWDIIFEDVDAFGIADNDHIIATIYDWKQDEIPIGKHFWHVGGKGRQAVDCVYDMLNEHRKNNQEIDQLADELKEQLPFKDRSILSTSRMKFLEWKAKQDAS